MYAGVHLSMCREFYVVWSRELDSIAWFENLPAGDILYKALYDFLWIKGVIDEWAVHLNLVERKSLISFAVMFFTFRFICTEHFICFSWIFYLYMYVLLKAIQRQGTLKYLPTQSMSKLVQLKPCAVSLMFLYCNSASWRLALLSWWSSSYEMCWQINNLSAIISFSCIHFIIYIWDVLASIFLMLR